MLCCSSIAARRSARFPGFYRRTSRFFQRVRTLYATASVINVTTTTKTMASRALPLLALALATQLSVEAFSQYDNSAWNARFADLGQLRLRRAVDVRRRALVAGLRVAERLCVRRLLNRDAYGVRHYPRTEHATSPPPRPCAFASFGDASSSSTPFSSFFLLLKILPSQPGTASAF